MKSLVVKVMMPVAAFLLASAGALSTKTSDAKTESGAVQGFKRIAAFQCTPVKLCDNSGVVACYSGTDQMWGKTNELSDCINPLTHRN